MSLFCVISGVFVVSGVFVISNKFVFLSGANVLFDIVNIG